MLLELLVAYPACQEGRGVIVRRLTGDPENGANWTMDTFNPGRAMRKDCAGALHFIIPVMQRHFDMAADA